MERITKEWLCHGLRVSNKDKKLWEFSEIGNPSNEILLNLGSRAFSCGAIYTVEHVAENTDRFYPDTFAFDRVATVMHWSSQKEKECKSKHVAALAYFEKIANKNAKKRLEKDNKLSVYDMTLNELKVYLTGIPMSQRKAITAMILEKLL